MKSIATILCLFVLGFQLKAEESKKTYERTFPKQGIKELVLSNKHGNIEVSQQEGEEIRVNVQVSVNAKSKAKADEMLALIQIQETRLDSYLNIETKFSKDLNFKQFLSGSGVFADYRVVVPKGIRLRIVASDGNTYLGNFEGELNADIRNGDFKAAALKGGEFGIRQGKGNFKVERVAFLNGEFKNCMVQIDSGEEVHLTAGSCESTLGSIDELNIRSSGGTVKIGDIEELTGSSSYTKYEVQDLAGVLDMNLKWGEMNVRNIQLLFSEVRLKASFTKCGLTFAPGAGYNLEIKRNRSAKIELPEKVQLEEKPAAERNMTVGSKFVGNAKYTGKVFLDLSGGSLFVQ